MDNFKTLNELKQNARYRKELLNRNIRIYEINGSDLTTSWKEIPLFGEYLQIKLHAKYADSGIEITFTRTGTEGEIIPVTDGMQYNKLFTRVFVRRKSEKGNSSKIIFYAGDFKDQITQNTQIDLSIIEAASTGLVQDASYSKTLEINCEKIYFKFTATTSGGADNNYDVQISTVSYLGGSTYLINETEFNNDNLEFEVNVHGKKQLNINITNRSANSLSLTSEITVK